LTLLSNYLYKTTSNNVAYYTLNNQANRLDIRNCTQKFYLSY